MLKHEISYPGDSATLFAKIAHEPWAVYLDSGQPGSQYGRYDIMAARPFITLTTRGEQTAIHDRQGFRVSVEDPFALLKQALLPYASVQASLPFEGGAIGYFGYDLARRLESLPTLAVDAEDMPQMMIGVYDWAVIVDHREKRAWLVSHEVDAQTTSA